MNIRYTDEINVTGGKIRGRYQEDSVAVFKGIPYAAPPVGKLRFRPPQPHEGWQGTLDCLEFGKSPLQNAIDDEKSILWTKEFLISNREMSEDCLTLNIWADLRGEDMPVIVYFFGGGLVSGGSSCEIYDGTVLAKQGVVYVTFNHREGTLGLLSCEKLSVEALEGTSGNYLLLDEIAVLRWVRENIRSFGGNPDNITIMGQSSGAMEVNALSVSPLAKGLFRQTISMSFNSCFDKTFGRPWISKEEGYEESANVLRAHSRSEEDLFSVTAEEFAADPKIKNLTIDGRVLDCSFREAIKRGDTNNTLTVMGMVPGDNLLHGPFVCLFGPLEKITEESQLKKAAGMLLGDRAEEFETLYLSDSRSPVEVKKAVEEDFLISSMLWFAGQRKKAGAKTPTLLYYFTHVLPGPMSDRFGAFHSCEVPYFFNVFSDFRKDYWAEDDFSLGKYVSDNLAKLVKDDEVSDFEKVPDDGYSYLRIGDHGGAICRIDGTARDLWFYTFEKMK